MGESIIGSITNNGLETICIALCVNLFTAVIKLPVKALAKRAKNSARITRFIVFLPVLLGFVFTLLYCECLASVQIAWKDFVTTWLASSSLSLTFYAIFEKLFPRKEKIMSDGEIEENRRLIKKIENIAENAENSGSAELADEAKKSAEKIVLRGKKNAENEIEKE